MKTIDKKYFLKNTQKLLKDNVIPPLTKDDIHEFKIGKSFFYTYKEHKEHKKVQTWLHNYFKDEIPLNNAAVAFRKKLSYLHLFEPHRLNYHFLRLDIRSFFHSIRIEDIKNNFTPYFDSSFIDEGETQTTLDAFINLISYKVPNTSENEKFKNKNILPMGFINSPMISNVIFRKLDLQIQKFCVLHNITYSRYADDMLFSSNKENSYVHSESFIKEMRVLLSQMSFLLNENKTIKSKHTISLNGYTIQYSEFENSIPGFPKNEQIINEIRLSNKKTGIIKKMIYMLGEKESAKSILKKLFKYDLKSSKFKYPILNPNTIKKYYEDQVLNKLTGYRSYLLTIIKFNKEYQCSQDSTITTLLEIIKILDTLIDKQIQKSDTLEALIEKHNKT